MIIGTRIGTSITALFTSFLVYAKRRDFRHGFEIGLANLVYAAPIAIFMFLLEYFTGFFHKVGDYFLVLDLPLQYKILDILVLPLVRLFSFSSDKINIFLGIILLIVSLKYIPVFMINVWGKKNIKKKINKLLGSKWKSFWFGLGLTALLMSTSITITFLIPFIVARLTNLKKVIPYIVGANLGGVSELVLGGLVLGSKALPAIFTYVSFSLIGLLWMVKPDLLFKITKYISKKTLHVSRRRALIFILAFILLAITLSFV